MWNDGWRLSIGEWREMRHRGSCQSAQIAMAAAMCCLLSHFVQTQSSPLVHCTLPACESLSLHLQEHNGV